MLQALSAESQRARAELRTLLRQRRRALTPAEQRRAARRLALYLHKHPRFQRARHIAFYLPSDGELDPRPLMNLALAAGKCCYLPVVKPGGRLGFRRYRPGTRLTLNRYGIAEPAAGSPVRPAWLMQLVLLPLVGFDRQGGRLGMGGGFYDRTFAHSPGLPAPIGRRWGLAHSCQQVDALPLAPWDRPLHAIATEIRLHAC